MRTRVLLSALLLETQDRAMQRIPTNRSGRLSVDKIDQHRPVGKSLTPPWKCPSLYVRPCTRHVDVTKMAIKKLLVSTAFKYQESFNLIISINKGIHNEYNIMKIRVKLYKALSAFDIPNFCFQ